MGLTVVSLFSGCGGMDLGFKQAGFDIIWANDVFKDAVETYKLNLGNHIVLGDITTIDSSQIPNNPTVIIGGFPCQGFSINNTKRSMQDSRNFLYKELLRVIKDKQPKFFVAENVKGLLSMENGKVIEMIVNDFSELGYKVDYKLLCASDYGVPQNRYRVIILGNRLGCHNPFPIETHSEAPNFVLKKAPTVAESIGDLADIPISDKPIVLNDKIIYNHMARTNVGETYLARKYEVDQHEFCDFLKEFKNREHLTIDQIADRMRLPKTQVAHWFRKDKYGSLPTKDEYLQLQQILCFGDVYTKQMTTLIEKPIVFEQVLRVTNWDRPSDTITATEAEIHINKQRRLSVREVARLQSFPDSFIFKGSLDNQYKQVGNAVPPLLARKIAEGISHCLLTKETM